MANPRAVASRIIQQVVHDGKSLSALIPQQLSEIKNPKDKALAQAIVFGVVRWFDSLDFLAAELMQKPIKAKDADVHTLLMMGLYQLRDMRIPHYAAISETVNLVPKKKKTWARGLLNGVLRNYQRQHEKLEKKLLKDEEAATAHPRWLIDQIRKDWPEDDAAILEANNAQAVMSLRVNTQKVSREDYLTALKEKDIAALATTYAQNGVTLEQPVEVDRLPGFFEGKSSVQDEAAQLSAQLLDPQSGEKVLDACAAPGGKTAALLERQTDIKVTAMDISESRLVQVSETLERLGLSAEVKAMDAAEMDQHFDAESFDRILLDVPCSATGVIRRNPDVKIHRQPEDIERLTETQSEILDAAWQILRPGGVLLYATCSIIRDENDKQVQAFLERTDDAREITPEQTWGRKMPAGRQILPGQDGMDGFYYALLQKA